MNLQQNRLTLSDLKRDHFKLRKVVESLVDFTDYITPKYGGNDWCCIHEDSKFSNKKSGTWHSDEDGVIRQWCYSCRKQYSVYDYIVLILQKDPLYFILESMSIQQLEDYINDFDFEESKFYKKIDEEKIKNKGILDIVNFISFGDV